MVKITDVKDKFKNKELFDQALTHKSWLNENNNSRESNERLEFLGDSVLGYVVTKEIYDRLPDKGEGYLTGLRANIVNTRNLAAFAKKIDLGKNIFLSRGEEEGLGRQNEYLLADTVEAIIGALFIDQGLQACEKFITSNLLSDLEEKLAEPVKDPKSRLQEYCYSIKLPIPIYKLTNTSGPDNAPEFTVQVFINEKMYGIGIGTTKQKAEQKAATIALEALSSYNK
jgi:ribonuclease III